MSGNLGTDSDRQTDWRSNAEYLAWVTKTMADRKTPGSSGSSAPIIHNARLVVCLAFVHGSPLACSTC